MAILFFKPRAPLAKAHVDAYTKKDGTYVKEHETKSAAKTKQVITGVQFGGKKPPKAAPKKSGGLFDHEMLVMRPKVYPDAEPHLQPNEYGEPVMINRPDKPSDPASWADPQEIATFTPGSPVPPELHGVEFKQWTDHPLTEVSWNFVDGQMPDLDEPPMPQAKTASGKPKEAAAGAIVEEPDGRVWLLRPTNGFGGYDATFPKGRVEHGMALQASAIKEVFEETGLKVEITGFFRDVERSTTVARYYTAKRVGGTPAAMGWEAQAVQLVPRDKLDEILNAEVDRRLVSKLPSVKNN